MEIIKTLFAGLLLVFNSYGLAQSSDSSQLELPVYQVDPCLRAILDEVVASNIQYYIPNNHFYAVSFLIGPKYRYLNISPQSREETSYRNYSGINKVGKMSFVLVGDFANDSLFEKTDLPKELVQIHMIHGYEKDLYMKEPSLNGYYLGCKGKPVFMDIYTKGRIKEFEAKVILPREN
ncbi:hypothetical protein D3H65_04270 [Paraflavitalea soli]|uniref:Uncharacterized protein n=1 Tax=Paraflavitalea soli TaxID=2315862 RepID=A0A3B7MI30_9BACT|nr:hypothetical protein [Paraflavitalea soli]AXY73237.1 hypothetical protein D3H65_04270 [Paraflavitalea soli]